MAATTASANVVKAAPSNVHVPANKKRKRLGADDSDDEEDEGKRGGKETTARNETERRMYEAVRKQGREVRSGGKMGQFGEAGGRRKPIGGASGGGEFQVVGSGELQRMLQSKN